ncbi:MAG: tRNA (adenosine(37)-N6)-threonylcarbamoyltransferase complex dimerization subunit type 1 TsaB [Lachnospiraceae bacterium]|nr:tRNA (adenosine(37)-N6)-threonylcarbamoyltransferase complex dimerization subunit type 1 TsaB [Lachnospiraceae bacterium]
MNILAIESSGLTASAAVMTDGKLVSEFTVNNKKTHSQTLLPMIDEVMRSADLKPEDLSCIAISRGPGSFTGLRIGSATAKGLGLALNKPLIEVPTLKALAYNMFGNLESIICPIMDARRQEVYTAAYDSELNDLIPEKACPLEELLRELEKFDKRVIFVGDGVPVYSEFIRENFMGKYAFAPETLLLQRAASVAAIGNKMYEEGKYISADAHTPVYLRKSQAERELGK